MAPMAFNARPSTGAIVRHHEKARAWAATTKRIEIRMPLDGRGPNGIRAHISGRRIGGQRWRYRYASRSRTPPARRTTWLRGTPCCTCRYASDRASSSTTGLAVAPRLVQNRLRLRGLMDTRCCFPTTALIMSRHWETRRSLIIPSRTSLPLQRVPEIL